MDRQAKFKAQTQNNFYGDNKADRLPVSGTAIRGTALDLNNVFSSEPSFRDNAFLTGKLEDQWVKKSLMRLLLTCRSCV